MGIFDKTGSKASSDARVASGIYKIQTDAHGPGLDKKARNPEVTLEQVTTSQPLDEHIHEKQPDAEDDELEDDTEYPTSYKLALITTGLCLSVFYLLSLALSIL